MDRFTEWEKTRPMVVEESRPFEDKTSAGAPKTAPVEAPALQPIKSTTGSSNPAEAGTAHSDVAANTTDSSREPSTSADARPAGGDAGGNVR
jgi:hypothetical protein